ncbi:hypothetical protein GNI_134610 [Gregarina niphandrodes]|uniref:Uncharacterized protein n=1 Tax=Gregarina niphandrodes TaxID=110365 RepID=A0A023B1M5_GRENI|nr:hypothetical protein GNI_134610 [Gregarina niphandrodes]EZG46185.1 hypothetical protein GNI_134610 [Gregarina niphandrodes]|eukprot:XP_011132346.1 hypothetical protein GNI_134610 [Gregarina niphandrodes]
MEPGASGEDAGLLMSSGAGGRSDLSTLELAQKLAELATRTTLTEERLGDLRKLLETRKKKAKKYDVSSPTEVIALLLDRIASLERRNDRLADRNQMLESVYTQLRKV